MELTMLHALVDEMTKICAVSSPSIKAPPTPGGVNGNMSAKPQGPVPIGKITGKALGGTNLMKTNYTTANTRAQAPDIALTSEQKALTPPVVRS